VVGWTATLTVGSLWLFPIGCWRSQQIPTGSGYYIRQDGNYHWRGGLLRCYVPALSQVTGRCARVDVRCGRSWPLLRELDGGGLVPRVRERRRDGAFPLQPIGYRPDLEGLRAVAVLAVVVYHAGVPGVPGGFVGVDIFFVLSGFLITGLLWRGRQESGRWRLADFYARRVRRLLPMSVLVLAVTTVVAMLVLSPLQVRSLLVDARWTALYAANYRFAVEGADYLTASGPPSPLQHYWSLGVEEQFYLLWPMLLVGAVFLGRRGRARAVAVAALAVVAGSSFVVALSWTGSAPAWAFFSLPSRAWELAVGGLLALCAPTLRRCGWVRLPLGWAGLAAIVMACGFIGASTPYPGTAALLPVLGTAAVIASGICAARPGSAWPVGRVLSVPPLPAIGRLSYSWYLWHWPVLILAPDLIGGALTAADRVVLVGVSLALAAVSYPVVENRFRFSTRLGPPRRAAVLALALTSVGVAATLVIDAALPPDRGTGTAAAVAFAPGTASATATRGLKATPPPSPAQVRPGGATGGSAAGGSTLTFAAVTSTTGLDTPTRSSAVRAAATKPAVSPQLIGEARRAEQLISTALGQSQVPGNLTPPLDEPDLDEASPFYNGCLLSWTVVQQPDCASADQASTKSVVLFGDSHATQWYPALNEVADDRHWALRTYTKTTCPPLDVPIFSPYLDRQYTECQNWRRDILGRIAADPPALVVLGIARHYSDAYHLLPYDKAWLSGMASMIGTIRATGAKVLVLGPIPKPPADVPTCLSAHLHIEQACDFPRATAVSESGIHAEQSVATTAGASYLDLTPYLCDPRSCPVIFGRNLVYRDDNHLTGGIAQLLTPVLAAEIRSVLPR